MDLKSQYEAYENSKRIYHIADEETAQKMNISIGSKYSTFPSPTTKQEAFEKLEKYTGLRILESLVKNFKQKFPINLRTLKDELELILEFIKVAEKINVIEAFDKYPKDLSKVKYYEYLKFKYDYYQNENIVLSDFQDFFSSNATEVFSKYFLYKNWLENEVQKTELSYAKIVEFINEAFFKLESFMNGKVNDYKHFDFDDTFTVLFSHTRKAENFTYINCKRIGDYWKLTEQIRVDYDKTNFTNTDAYQNEEFCIDCEAILNLNLERLDEFLEFETPDEKEESERRFSISQIVKHQTSSSKVLDVNFSDNLTSLSDENLFPRIFKNSEASKVFQRLRNEFGNTKENLSNYSFAFHKMFYEGLLHQDLQHKTYIEFLSEFDINIDRIKPKSDIGKIAFRDIIYNRCKLS